MAFDTVISQKNDNRNKPRGKYALMALCSLIAGMLLYSPAVLALDTPDFIRKAPQPKGTQLSAIELLDTLVGNTFVGKNAIGTEFHVVTYDNGTIAGALAGTEDVGAWQLDGDAICMRWSVLNLGILDCFNVYKDQEAVRFHFVVDNGIDAEGTVTSGDPNHYCRAFGSPKDDARPTNAC